MTILQEPTRLVNAGTIIGLDRDSTGDKLTVIIGDGERQQAVAIFPGAILAGYAKFQRAILHAAGIYFCDRRFEGQAGRRRWKRAVAKLLRGATR
jgi:hypothetical protein